MPNLVHVSNGPQRFEDKGDGRRQDRGRLGRCQTMPELPDEQLGIFGHPESQGSGARHETVMLYRMAGADEI